MKKDNLKNKIFFSIVIPAHNEEKYIEKTLLSLRSVNYPLEKLEVIVVENGSTDRTLDIINKSSPDWFKVISINSDGVSKAKNIGIEYISENSEWVIFLDADTYFDSDFLN